MQEMPENCREAGFDLKSCMIPENNIMAGAREISQYLHDFNGNLTLALAAYNAGEGSVLRFHGVPPYKETEDYVRIVPQFYKQFQASGKPIENLNTVREKIDELARNLNTLRQQHELSVKNGTPTPCMAQLQNKKPVGAGAYGALSCAIYSMKPDWSVVAEIESKAATLLSSDGSDGMVYKGGKFPWPTKGQLTGFFGENRGNHIHQGVDIAAPSGTPIYAVADGVVTVSKADPNGFGWFITIDHGGGISTLYGHMYPNTVTVQVGQRVSKGQMIARIGDNGHSTGAHLHFEVHQDGKPVDPLQLIGK